MPYETRAIRSFSAVRKQPVAKRSLEVKRRHIRNVAMLIAIVITCALLFVWTRVRVIQLGYDVSKLRKEASELREQKNYS